MRHVAVVGGSRGIGRATVMRFAQNGDRVLSTSRSGVHDKDFPPQVVSRAVNMAEVDAPARILDAIEQDLGRLDVLCLVAGVFPACPLSDMTSEALSEILQISPRTVNKHLEQIFEKMGVENRASATAIAVATLSQ